MNSVALNTKKSLPLALALGFLGGLALIITTIIASDGPIIFIPYAALIIAIIGALRAINWATFSRRFTASLLTFMVATIIFYIFDGIFHAGTMLEIPIWGHLWRLGLMAGIGSFLSLPVAYLADLGIERKTQLAK